MPAIVGTVNGLLEGVPVALGTALADGTYVLDEDGLEVADGSGDG